jgi:hypothetical protein
MEDAGREVAHSSGVLKFVFRRPPLSSALVNMQNTYTHQGGHIFKRLKRIEK